MPKILIVDDNEIFRMVLEEKLTKEHFDVVTAGTGEEGLKQAKKEQPDMILLDVKMPGMSGITFLLELNREDSTNDIPVLVTSDLGSFDKLADRVDLGVRGFMLKAETSTEEFVTRIKKELDIESE
ncbi:response regulator [candidate division WWE3 bacterium]|uniref:Response regulator n=1 Tax=candidate division WWE3 bacterium TaxID=2053526 RepID=A0A955LVP0_UNCKA|nr:response regulator [candidate division WWE3 bacterium]